MQNLDTDIINGGEDICLICLGDVDVLVIIRTSRKDKKTNVEILAKVGLKSKEMLNMMKRSKLTYYGHISRHLTMQNEMQEGRIEGKRGSRRPIKSWDGTIKERTGMAMQECGNRTRYQSEWSSMASNICKE